MTQQDDITQPVLTDAEIIKHLEESGITFMWIEGQNPLHMTAGSQQVDALLAGIRAMLSKLRAPVADERRPVAWRAVSPGYKSAWHAVEEVTPPTEEDVKAYSNYYTIEYAYAAPASAPVADGWQPIDTAPAGQRVLLGPRRAPVVGIVKHYEDPDSDKPAIVCNVVHYNDTVLVADYRCSEWAPLVGAPVAGEAQAALNEWFDKTDFIQKRIASGDLPVMYLGWHRADVMRDLIDAAARNQVLPSGCILVQEADTIPHTHPEYGPGIFFTEDARIEFDAAPQASAEAVRNAALEEAAAICDSVDNHANPMTSRDCADAIRALKQPQADKDGGQQRDGQKGGQ